MKYFSKAMVAIAAISLAGAANAAIIFSDNFDGENGGVGALNYNSFAHWTVLDGTVDLIGNGFFDFLPGNGLTRGPRWLDSECRHHGPSPEPGDWGGHPVFRSGGQPSQQRRGTGCGERGDHDG
ncbi:MAG: hypothetical protein R3E86_18090 [Pseudomonadales bacterium]